MELLGAINKSLDTAGKYLIDHQSDDGSWRSGVHGVFRDGTGLTPHVLTVLGYLDSDQVQVRSSVERGVAWINALPQDQQIRFPVYSAAEVILTLTSHNRDKHPDAPRAWVERVRERQLNASLGWDPRDIDFGGWGYSPGVPRKEEAGKLRELMVDSNLSATLYAVGALRVARVPQDDVAFRDALVFIDRCQNFADASTEFDDGGFVFTAADDAARNKAGLAGTDKSGHPRFHSYGSMTADGVRAMLACGRGRDHPRVVAARAWLVKHFDATRNPGAFNPDREPLRDGSYYYWAWSVAHAMARLDVRENDWTTPLARELLKRQRPDGSWKNDASDVKEDDPLVATPFAAAAMAICRDRIMGTAAAPAPLAR